MKDEETRRIALRDLCDKIADLTFDHRYALHQIYTNARKAERMGKELDVLRARRRAIASADLKVGKRKTRKRQ